MSYVYIFEDADMIQTEEPPTEEEFKSIANGVLEVFVVEGTIHGIDENNKLYEISDR